MVSQIFLMVTQNTTDPHFMTTNKIHETLRFDHLATVIPS